MKPVAATFQYLKHRFKAKRWDSFHSPYLFHLFITCCDEKNNSPLFEKIERERNRFKDSDESIERVDYGAGSVFSTVGKQQKIANIARHALSNPFQCRFLSRLVKYTQAKTVLEFGTSLGISGAYLATGNPEAHVITVEGDPALVIRSRKVFETLALINIQILEGTFESFISTTNDLTPVDILFLDGNHQSKALLEYYHSLKHLYKPETVIVVDDIYWSEDMKNGWNELIALQEVTQSVDCYHFGLLFFNQGFLQKENHVVKLPLRSVYS